ncbi:unnamed protein product [Trichogramma brassicae]|uniref:CCHC-type domain-containing protein n=1 Tax=Trichogramma brassicae TaxID=86971 RepID=A0A6H5ITI7_9HYME|nr:unnamed protein product [Trichogramma brassicae]CAB0040721.1 unnamed protein product [Trichogramma brassicae]
MRDGQQDRQAPGSTDEVGETSQLESSSLPSMPTKTMTPSAVIAASMTRRIIGAPLLARDAPLPTPAEFATGCYEEKIIRIEGLVEGLNTFIFGRNNLHKVVIKYSLSLEQAILALKKTKQKQVPPRPPSAEKAVCTFPIFSFNATGLTNWSRDQFAPASRANVSSAARSFSDVEKTTSTWSRNREKSRRAPLLTQQSKPKRYHRYLITPQALRSVDGAPRVEAVPKKKEEPEIRLTGSLFNGLKPMPMNELDPPLRVCFNCRGMDHVHKACKKPKRKNVCWNYGRNRETIDRCPRYKEAYFRWSSWKQNPSLSVRTQKRHGTRPMPPEILLQPRAGESPLNHFERLKRHLVG